MNTGSALARFTITLSQAVTEPVQVEWFTSDGTAKAGVDYAANKGTVLFAPGETSKTVDILVYGRAVGSEDRSFFVEMLPPTNAILGASIGECIITVDTSGSTPVTQIIVPTGPQGIQGKSAYQSYLDTTTDNPPMTEAEWVESLKGDPEEIAQEVAPLIDVGNTVLTAEGTETLGHPDQTTVKAVARRVAYASPAKIATLLLADGDNTISSSMLTGDAISFASNGFVPLVLHAGSMAEPNWDENTDGTITIKAATAGDILYAVQYSLTSAKRRFASEKMLNDAIADVRADLADDSGEGLIGTTHRGTVALDLDAIDRRPDGYGNNPSVVLSNGQDVQINTNLSMTAPVLPGDYQVVQGVGGSITMTAVARAVHTEFKKGFTIRGLRIIGNIVNGPSTGNTAYGVQLEDSENFQILGLDAKQFSGAMEILRCNDFVVRDVYARNMRYHDNVAAGGYGVLIGGCKRALIDGINFRASTPDGDLGRHSLYISVDALGNFCEDIIVKNLIALYVNIDNRNMPAAVVRRSNRCMIDGFNINGSNGGIGLNADNGNITDFQIRNGHMKIIQYDDNAVYGISGGVDNQPGTVVGLRVDNVTFEGEVKSGVTPTTVRLHALAVTCRDSYFTNTRIKSHGSANPILVQPGAFNVTFDGVKDFVSAGSASGAALIRFMGSNSNIKVFNLDTARAPFVGLENVTDLTVNWERFARIVSANGTVTTTDTDSLIASVSTTGTGELTVAFKPHVTADAVRKCTVTPASVAGLVLLPEISGKNLILRFYNGSGVLVPLGSSIVSADIRLHS